MLQLIQYFWEIITCDLSIYKMDHPDLTVSNFMENSIGPNGLNMYKQLSRVLTFGLSLFKFCHINKICKNHLLENIYILFSLRLFNTHECGNIMSNFDRKSRFCKVFL